MTSAHTSVSLLLALGTAMVGSLFASDAWHNVTFAAAEVRNPRRNLPLSLMLGVVLVFVLYLLANVAYLVVASPAGRTWRCAQLPRAASSLPPKTGWARRWPRSRSDRRLPPFMALLILISTFGCMNGMILAGARVYYAMARDGLFFRRMGTLNRHGVPQNGLVLQGVWAALLTLSGTYSDLLDYVIFAVLIFYVMTIGGLFVLRRKRPEAVRPYRAIGYPLLPAIYVIAALLIAVDLLISSKTRANTWPGLLIVLAGVPVYLVWQRWLATFRR